MRSETKQVLMFFFIVLFLSFCVFWGPIALLKIPAANFTDGEMGPVWSIVLFIIGGFAPSAAGLILTRIYEGKGAVKRIFRDCFKINIGFRWIVYILAVNVLVAFLTVVLYNLVCKQTFDISQFYRQLPSFFPLLVLGPLSEEFGWRGFAIKRMLKICNANLTSLIIGAVWALWHLPLFYMVGTTQYEYSLPFILFMISTVSSSFIYTYFYLKTNHNIFSAVLMHWFYTYVIQVIFTTIVRSELYNWLDFIPVLILGIIFAILMPNKTNGKIVNGGIEHDVAAR